MLHVCALYQVTDIVEALQSLKQILSGTDHTHQTHVPGTAEVSPKLQLPEEQLVHYLQTRHGLGRKGEGLVLRQFRHGQSNPTYYVAYGGQEMVLRKKPVREREGRGREGYVIPVMIVLAWEVTTFSTCCGERIQSHGGSKERRSAHTRTDVSL